MSNASSAPASRCSESWSTKPGSTGRSPGCSRTSFRCKDENGEIIGTFGISKDVTKTRQMEAELEKAHKELVDASRSAGMAEVATGVLHNVGNVLNSLNVSASVIATGLRMSKAESLAKLGASCANISPDLGDFLTHDPKGKRVPEFLASLARHAVEERDRLLQEVTALQNNIDHIKEIVSMQQAYATMVGVVEPLDPVAMMEDSLRMNAGALVRHEVSVVRDFQTVPPVLGEKAKSAPDSREPDPQREIRLRRNRARPDKAGDAAHCSRTDCRPRATHRAGQRRRHSRRKISRGFSATASPRVRTATASACTPPQTPRAK